MHWHFKREIFPLVLLIIALALAVYAYIVLPDTIPSHFDAQGRPDHYQSKTQVILLELGLMVALYLLLTFIPFIDPFWKKIEKKYDLFLLFRDLALAFTLFLSVVIMLSAKRGFFQSDLYGVGMGLLFVLLGNYLPKLPRNFFFGIRSPWTLASEVVWKRTHALSGWLFVAAGIVIMALSILKVNLLLTLAVVLGPVVIVSAVLYPLLLYRRLQRNAPPDL